MKLKDMYLSLYLVPTLVVYDTYHWLFIYLHSFLNHIFNVLINIYEYANQIIIICIYDK